MPLGIDGNAGHFTQIEIGRQLEKIHVGGKRNLRRISLREERMSEEGERDESQSRHAETAYYTVVSSCSTEGAGTTGGA